MRTGRKPGPKPGTVNNPKGRPKGSQNNVTRDLKELIQNFVDRRFAEIDKIFNQLEPKDQAKLLFELMQYAVPKLSSVQSDINLKATQSKIAALFPTDAELDEQLKEADKS